MEEIGMLSDSSTVAWSALAPGEADACPAGTAVVALVDGPRGTGPRFELARIAQGGGVALIRDGRAFARDASLVVGLAHSVTVAL